MGKNIRLSQYDSTHAIDWVDAIRHDGQVKGSAKITLTNEKTGRIEQVEHDNIVTDAVKNIFRYNYNVASSFPDLLPLKKLFGGVLLFRDPVEDPTADMVYPWNDNENPMIACAGDEGHNTRNPYRGNPNNIASEISADGRSMKQVWEWNTSQGNGVIGSLSLTSAKCGNMGLKPYDYDVPWLELGATNKDSRYSWTSSNVPDQYMFRWSLDECDQRPQIVVSEITGEYGLNIGVEKRTGDPEGTWTFYERRVEHPWLKVGFEAGITDWVFREERSCKFTFSEQLSSRGQTAMFIQTSPTHYYVIAMTSAEVGYGGGVTIYVAKIDRSTMTLTESRKDVFTDTVQTSNCFMNTYPYVVRHTTGGTSADFAFFHIAVNAFYMDETGWMFATSRTTDGLNVICDTAKYKLDGDGKGAYQYVGQKIRTRATLPPDIDWNRNLQQTSRFMVGRNMIAEANSDRCGFYNGDMWYDTAYLPTPNGVYAGGSGIRHILVPTIAPFSYPAIGYSTCYSGDSTRPHVTGFAYSNLYLATVNSLEEQVEKTSVMGMRVEYTLNLIS